MTLYELNIIYAHAIELYPKSSESFYNIFTKAFANMEDENGEWCKEKEKREATYAVSRILDIMNSKRLQKKGLV